MGRQDGVLIKKAIEDVVAQKKGLMQAESVEAKYGPPTALSKEEDRLAKYNISMVQMGFALSPQDIQALA